MHAQAPTPCSSLPGLPAEEGLLWQWNVPATLGEVRRAGLSARAFLEKHGACRENLDAWELLFAEAGNNVALHGGEDDPSQVLGIELRILPGRVVAQFRDHTAGFAWPDTISLPGGEAESGRGLYIIEALTTTRSYQRGPDGNLLVLERAGNLSAGDLASCVGGKSDSGLEETLDAMTEELSACYESLSAIFRFTAEARQTTTLADFADRLLRHLVTITSAECGTLRVSANGALITLASHGIGPENNEVRLRPFENAAITTRQDQWIDPAAAVSTDMPLSGLIHPFYHNDELMGLVSICRSRTADPLNAGEVNIIHTFSEFFAQQVLSRRHAETAIQASIARRELELAAEIQRSLLPRRFPDIPGLTLSGHCESALTVGGDFYDVIPWTSRGFFFIVADVMGKGVGASMMAAVTRSVFRSLNQLHQTPGRAMDRAARLLFDDLDRLEMFVTAAIGVVDLHEGVVRLANAGHCPVHVALPDGSLVDAEPSIAPLGLEKDPRCCETTIPFPEGARLLIYSDGLVDPRDLRRPFGCPDEVGAWLADAAKSQPTAESLKRQLLARIGCLPTQGPTAAQADDQTFLIIARDSTNNPTH